MEVTPRNKDKKPYDNNSTKGQARNIIAEKIVEFHRDSPNLAREICELRTTSNDPYVEFHNGSFIRVVASNDNARSIRGNLLIADEFRMIKLDIINKVLRRFLGAPRHPKYLDKDEYAHLKERNKEIYISSAWYKHDWSWEKFLSFKDSMVDMKQYFVCGMPYQLSILENLLDKEQVIDEMNETDFDSTSFEMEMGAIFFGESEKAFFKLDDIQKCRINYKSFIPPTNLEFVENKNKKKKSSSLPKQDGEIRIIGADLAAVGEGDNTIFTLMRLLPSGENYTRQVVYIESLNGAHSEIQAIKLKQLYYDFECDYIVMDTAGVGMSVFDDCSRILYDNERDVEYPPFTSMNNEKMMSRSLNENALPVIYSIKATPEINHQMNMSLKACFEKKKIKLLVNEMQARENFIEKQNFMNKDSEEQISLLKPFIQTTMLVNELINLEYEIRSGLIKIKEVGRNRKDRYSSLAYANYYANILEQDLKSGTDEDPLMYLFITET